VPEPLEALEQGRTATPAAAATSSTVIGSAACVLMNSSAQRTWRGLAPPQGVFSALEQLFGNSINSIVIIVS